MTARFVALLTVVAVLALALPALAIAHAVLVESDPADGATITTPYTLTATFAEDIDPEASSITVTNSAGVQVASGAIVLDDPTSMVVELPVLPDGVYTVSWTTVTPDDNGIERGTFTFTAAAAGSTPAPTPIVLTGGTPGSNDIIIALVLAAIGIGAVVLFVFLRSRR